MVVPKSNSSPPRALHAQVFEMDGVECSRVLSSFRSGNGAVLGLASSTTSTGVHRSTYTAS